MASSTTCLSVAALSLSLLAACSTPRGSQLLTRPTEDHFGPFATDAAPIVASSSDAATADRTPYDGFVDFVFTGYSRVLTRIDGPRCEHRPTCSHYAYLAIKQQGYVLGSLLTIDRLLRGSRSSALRSLPLYKVEDGVRYYYDPVENNTFWY